MSSRLQRILLMIVAAALIVLCAAIALTYWLVGPSLRCERPSEGPARPGLSARTITSGGLERCYYLYAPPDYDPARAAPAVFSFHGFLSNPTSHALITGWHKLADKEGFLVIYPQGTGFPQRWDAGETWGVSDVDDVEFFTDLIDDLSTIAAVDPARIYVNGFSNGGGMTVHIGCQAAESVTAIGSVAGAIVSMEDCSPSRPVPAMAFHGTSDPIVKYGGGDLEGWLLRWAAGLTNAPSYFLGAEDWTAAWAEGNGCDPTPETIPPQGDVRGTRYTGCEQDATVVLYTIDGGGHAWPAGMPIPFVGRTTYDINATEELWEFFQAYSLDD